MNLLILVILLICLSGAGYNTLHKVDLVFATYTIMITRRLYMNSFLYYNSVFPLNGTEGCRPLMWETAWEKQVLLGFMTENQHIMVISLWCALFCITKEETSGWTLWFYIYNYIAKRACPLHFWIQIFGEYSNAKRKRITYSNITPIQEKSCRIYISIYVYILIGSVVLIWSYKKLFDRFYEISAYYNLSWSARAVKSSKAGLS